MRAFRQWRAATRNEETATATATATGMLWALLLTAAVIVLPILVAAMNPQHPAP